MDASRATYRNGTLQAASFILALHAPGADIGVVFGFAARTVQAAFFRRTTLEVNFVCNIGYGGPADIMPRKPRLDFEEIMQRPAGYCAASGGRQAREAAMPELRHLSAKVAVGGQPTVDDLRELKAQGFVAVVNLRTVGEAGQPLSPEAEGFAAQEAGLAYSHLPVAIPEIDPGHVHRLRAAIAAAQGPVYVHCGAGQRACALGLLATAGPGIHGDDLIARAEAAGLPVTDERLASFVRTRTERDGWELLQAM